MSNTSKKLYNLKNSKVAEKRKQFNIKKGEDLLLLNEPSDKDNIFDALQIKSIRHVVREETKDLVKLNHFENDLYKGRDCYVGKDIKKI